MRTWHKPQAYYFKYVRGGSLVNNSGYIMWYDMCDCTFIHVLTIAPFKILIERLCKHSETIYLFSFIPKGDIYIYIYFHYAYISVLLIFEMEML